MGAVRKKLAERFLDWLASFPSWNDFLLRIMLWCGSRLFDYVVTWSPDGKTVTVAHFAASEREFNISVRSIVEQLDEPKGE